MNDADDRTPFERLCRVPGTRCNWIMAQIERGHTDAEIADALKAKNDRWRANREADAATIRVYRAALEGKLTEPGGDAHKTADKAAQAAEAARMKNEGMKIREIAAAMGLTMNQVEYRIRGHRKRERKRKAEEPAKGTGGVKQAVEELGLDDIEALKLMMKYGDDAAREAIARALLNKNEEGAK